MQMGDAGEQRPREERSQRQLETSDRNRRSENREKENDKGEVHGGREQSSDGQRGSGPPCESHGEERHVERHRDSNRDRRREDDTQRRRDSAGGGSRDRNARSPVRHAPSSRSHSEGSRPRDWREERGHALRVSDSHRRDARGRAPAGSMERPRSSDAHRRPPDRKGQEREGGRPSSSRTRAEEQLPRRKTVGRDGEGRERLRQPERPDRGDRGPHSAPQARRSEAADWSRSGSRDFTRDSDRAARSASAAGGKDARGRAREGDMRYRDKGLYDRKDRAEHGAERSANRGSMTDREMRSPWERPDGRGGSRWRCEGDRGADRSSDDGCRQGPGVDSSARGASPKEQAKSGSEAKQLQRSRLSRSV